MPPKSRGIARSCPLRKPVQRRTPHGLPGHSLRNSHGLDFERPHSNTTLATDSPSVIIDACNKTNRHRLSHMSCCRNTLSRTLCTLSYLSSDYPSHTPNPVCTPFLVATSQNVSMSLPPWNQIRTYRDNSTPTHDLQKHANLRYLVASPLARGSLRANHLHGKHPTLSIHTNTTRKRSTVMGGLDARARVTKIRRVYRAHHFRRDALSRQTGVRALRAVTA